ncbi:hypothetical protein BX666DRAFT_1053803 [Dichotomocladium elegans]|nr:hypothetical protein BX666DRAFT_1053803 [Dichotomocladium elegans]
MFYSFYSGYIEHLESRVSHQDKEIAALRATNTRLEDVNRQLVEELDQWRQWVESQQPTPPPPPPPPPQQPSLESANNTSPDLFPLLDMHEYTLCDFSTNLSHIAIPQLNFGQIFNEKSSKPLTPPSELMQSFPLLAPALMSMVLHHTMTSVVGQDFMGSMTPVCPKPTFPEAKALLVASDAKRKDDHVELEREHAVEQGQSSLDEWILKKHYVWYTWMRMRGYSHEQLVMRARACAGQSQECFVDRVHRKINVITAFCSVATTLLRHPDHAALMPAIVRNHPRLFNPNSQLMIDHAATCSTRLITSSTN